MNHTNRTSTDHRMPWWLPGTFILLAVASATLLGSQHAHTQAPGSMSAMVYEGFTEPEHDIMVAATEIGRLDSVTVKVGDRVTEGQVIGHLEDELQQSSVRIAQLQTEMTGELNAAKAEFDLRQSRAQLLRQLASDGMARPDELARAETDLRIAAARYLTSQEQLKLRKLELERFVLQLERRQIRIPMAGVISEVFHQPGEYITPADPAVARLLVMEKLNAIFNIPVEETATIGEGTPVRVFLRSSSQSIDASITSISPDIDGESGTVRVLVELDNSDRRLLVGDRCTLRMLPKGSSRQAPVRSSLRPNGTIKQ